MAIRPPLRRRPEIKPLRSKFTYANVISTVCLFLLLGGGTAFAASQLGKNSVGSKQLKKNAVTAAKIKANAVTGAKIKNGAITGAKVAPGTLTGANLNLSTLGTVPSANTAKTADSATTAGTAKSADSVAGRIGIAEFIGEGTQTIATIGPFTLSAECTLDDEGEEKAELILNTSQSGSAMDDNNGDEFDDWEAGHPAGLYSLDEPAGHVDIEAAEEVGLTAIAPDGTAIVFQNETLGFNIAGHPGQCYLGGLLQKTG